MNPLDIDIAVEEDQERRARNRRKLIAKRPHCRHCGIDMAYSTGYWFCVETECRIKRGLKPIIWNREE